MLAEILGGLDGRGFGGALFYIWVFAGGFAAFHDGFSHAGGEFFGEVVGLVVAVDVDGFSGGVYDDLAVMAGTEMLFHFGEEIGVDLTVEVVG